MTDSRANATGEHPSVATRRRFSSHVAPVVWLCIRAASSQWLREFKTPAISISSPSFKTMPLNILGMPKTLPGHRRDLPGDPHPRVKREGRGDPRRPRGQPFVLDPVAPTTHLRTGAARGGNPLPPALAKLPAIACQATPAPANQSAHRGLSCHNPANIRLTPGGGARPAHPARRRCAVTPLGVQRRIPSLAVAGHRVGSIRSVVRGWVAPAAMTSIRMDSGPTVSGVHRA